MGYLKIIMGYIYNPDGFDWMNFKVSKENPYTFHHIQEERRGGKARLDNGALLTDVAHRFLNYLDHYLPKKYEELQEVFREINQSNMPPTNDIVKKVDEIIYPIFLNPVYFHKKYLMPYEKIYFQARRRFITSRKLLAKCLE